MTLLFITQKLHGQDAFVVLWVHAFIRQGYRVKVICLEEPQEQYAFEVYSLGKSAGFGKVRQILKFWKLIVTLRYDRVFIHMSPVWYVLGVWWWTLRRTPAYLWYTHYTMQVGVLLFKFFGRRFFCATSQSLPRYEGSPKKIVTGHGIDLSFWPMRNNVCTNPHQLLMVHRLSRSKRVELSLRALLLLPEDYTIDIYGIEAERDYITELRELVCSLGLTPRVIFHGTVPMSALPEIYSQHRFILNMASETVDKTMLEAMTCGCYPVTTKRNADAVGIPESPKEDSPEAIASFVQIWKERLPLSPERMYEIVRERHSLEELTKKVDRYMRTGA